MITDKARNGLVAHLAIAQRLIELDFEVLEPVGNHLRYDLAYYANNPFQLVRIQCKAAWLSRDKTCLYFNSFNMKGNGKRQKQGYRGEAEYFGVYSSDTRKVYMIPVEECPIGSTTLRLEATGKQGKNQFSERGRWAKDYEI